jgi:hypothetical protein
MSFNEQQSNEEGWQTVRPAFGRRAQERPVFGRQAQAGDMERPVFGRQAQAGDMERPAFGRRAEGSGGRADAPSAFGGGNSDRRQQEEARAAFRAAEAREKKTAEATAAAKQAEAENFTSESSYPSLGPSPSSKVAPPALNYKQAVKDMIAKEAEAELAAAAAAEEAAYATATSIREPSRQTYSRQRILDELEDDYSGPEEDEEDNNGEVNADIGSSRRRGDKGIW